MKRLTQVIMVNLTLFLQITLFLFYRLDTTFATNNVDRTQNNRNVGDSNVHAAHDDNDEEGSFVIKEPPIENGLLVLNHENLLHTMTGKTLKLTNMSSGTLLLLVFHEPWCQFCLDVIQKLEKASHLIQQQIQSLDFAIEHNLAPPIFGKMDTSGFENDDLSEFFALFESRDNGLPALKFIYFEQQQKDDAAVKSTKEKDKEDANEFKNDLDEDHQKEQGNDDIGRTIIDFVGESKSAEDIVDTVMHYWYRFIVSSHVSHETMQEIMGNDDSDSDNGNRSDREENTKEKKGANDGDLIPIRPIFTFHDMDSVISFVQSHENLYHPVVQDLMSVSEREETYIRDLLADDEEAQHNSLIGFVQCRLEKQLSSSDTASNLFQQFDDLAQTFTYRRDTVFFVIKSKDCNWLEIKNDDEMSADTNANAKQDWNGHVRVMIIDTSPSNKNEPSWIHGDVFPPRDINSSLTMTQFAIIQSTPSVLWFDKFSTATMAFPIYRKVHLVLFIDMHTPRLKDGSFNYTSTAYNQSKYAISQLKKTALRHHQTRPSEDVVFLIIPSTETQILTTFGVDIWSDVDETCQASNLEQCYLDDIPLLPMPMITSRKESNTTMMRYYLPSDQLLRDNDGGNAIDDFLSSYLGGKLVSQFKSEPTPSQRMLSSGIQLLTADTFDELVMSEKKKHSLVLFYAPHCGHCKRLNVIWRELAGLIREFQWDSLVDVMIMDVTKNDVIHKMIDVRYLPSIYYFPRDNKDFPGEMILEGDDEDGNNIGKISDPYSILDWMIENNDFDVHELVNLADGRGRSENLAQST